jgi:hypothetical protein
MLSLNNWYRSKNPLGFIIIPSSTYYSLYFYLQIPVISPYTIQIVTYVGVAISLVILLAAVITFTCLRYTVVRLTQESNL